MSDTGITTAAYKDVRCDKCQRAFVCTPSSDYYNWEGVVTDGVCVGGVCERCLIGNLPMRTIEVSS